MYFLFDCNIATFLVTQYVISTNDVAPIVEVNAGQPLISEVIDDYTVEEADDYFPVATQIDPVNKKEGDFNTEVFLD